MRTWGRVDIPVLCGRCGVLIDAGSPALAIRFVGTKRHLIRCEDCEGPAPGLPISDPGPQPDAAPPSRERGNRKPASEWTPYKDA